MIIRLVFAMTIVAGGLAATPAMAESKAARWLMAEQVREGCGGGAGRFVGGVVERDLTGDGRDDLILHHGGLECDGGNSQFCGVQACSALVYVRRGDLLKLETEILAVSVDVNEGNPPTITVVAHGGASRTIRWTGSAFR